MSSYIMNSNNMDDQYRRGINRPNANRLTLSLGPLVAQRSLLFRIQSDLVHKLTYGEVRSYFYLPTNYHN